MIKVKQSKKFESYLGNSKYAYHALQNSVNTVLWGGKTKRTPYPKC